MSEVEAKLERTAVVEITAEELRWRMEKVVQFAAATGYSIDNAALQFNKGLAILDGQGNASGETG